MTLSPAHQDALDREAVLAHLAGGADAGAVWDAVERSVDVDVVARVIDICVSCVGAEFFERRQVAEQVGVDLMIAGCPSAVVAKAMFDSDEAVAAISLRSVDDPMITGLPLGAGLRARAALVAVSPIDADEACGWLVEVCHDWRPALDAVSLVFDDRVAARAVARWWRVSDAETSAHLDGRSVGEVVSIWPASMGSAALRRR